MRINID